jgi:hypothetical protein
VRRVRPTGVSRPLEQAVVSTEGLAPERSGVGLTPPRQRPITAPDPKGRQRHAVPPRTMAKPVTEPGPTPSTTPRTARRRSRRTRSGSSAADVPSAWCCAPIISTVGTGLQHSSGDPTFSAGPPRCVEFVGCWAIPQEARPSWSEAHVRAEGRSTLAGQASKSAEVLNRYAQRSVPPVQRRSCLRIDFPWRCDHLFQSEQSRRMVD